MPAECAGIGFACTHNTSCDSLLRQNTGTATWSQYISFCAIATNFKLWPSKIPSIAQPSPSRCQISTIVVSEYVMHQIQIQMYFYDKPIPQLFSLLTILSAHQLRLVACSSIPSFRRKLEVSSVQNGIRSNSTAPYFQQNSSTASSTHINVTLKTTLTVNYKNLDTFCHISDTICIFDFSTLAAIPV